jgi:hypothetical protein
MEEHLQGDRTMEYEIDKNVTADEAYKFVARARRKSFFLTVQVDMPSGNQDRFFPYTTSLRVSQRQVLDVLNDAKRFAETKKENKGETALIHLRVSEHCIWIS